MNEKFVRTSNEIRLLSLIQKEGPISRNELANRIKLSKVAVSKMVNQLDSDGFILEIGKGQSTTKGGKRPTLLKLNPENGYVIGIQIKRGLVTIGFANVESNILGIEQLTYTTDTSVRKITSAIFDKIDELMAVNNVQPKQLICIGIGIPGFIDYEKGKLKYAVTLREWINFPLSSRFSERFNVPTIVENDVNIITLSESLLGAGQGYSNLVCILVQEGTGAGILVNGQLVRGETSNAGEIGFLELGSYVANFNRLENLYHNQRYFGEILSEVNLFDTLKMKFMSNSNYSTKDSGIKTLKDMLVLGDSGNSIVQKVLDEYAYLLSIICMNIIKLINPSLIILSGRVIENSNYLFNKLKQLIRQNMMNIPFEPGSIVVGQLKDNAGILGAITMALQTIFEPSFLKGIQAN